MIKRYCGCIMEGSERQEFRKNSLQMTWKNKQPALFGTKLWPSGSHMPYVCFHFFPTSLLFSPSHLLPCNFTHQKSTVCACACACACVCVFSHLVVPDSLWPYSLLGSCPCDFPRKNTEVDCHFLLQGIFPTQESIPSHLHLMHCRSILYLWATRETNKPLIKFLSIYDILDEIFE